MNAAIETTITVATTMSTAATIAVVVTGLVALVMVVLVLRRTVRPTRLTLGISGACALAVLIGALLVGGSLTQPPTAAASEDSAPREAGTPSIELKLTGPQLPTL